MPPRLLTTLGLSLLVASAGAKPQEEDPLRVQAARHAEDAAEGLRRCRDYVRGWLAHADETTGLIPRNLHRDVDVWNARDSAADNYPFMVLTASFVDRPLFEGRMLEMLRTEERLTSRVDALPDTWSFSKQDFAHEEVALDRLVFGASEYVKDGLLPLTEWLGPSPWSERMLALLDAIWAHAEIETPAGLIPSNNVEVNGELLQALSRVYWMTGEEKYLEWALRLGDHYLLGENHPTRDTTRLRLRDHDCEIVSGLVELYATTKHARPEHAERYHAPVHEMIDRILEVGRNEHGLFWDWIDPRTGEHAKGVADTWGYNLDAVYTLWLLDGNEAHRAATRKALGNLDEHYRSYAWEGTSSDGYADSIEGAINLHGHEPIDSVATWIDREIRVMWSKQQADGTIEGWHGDGNFARTTIMYCLWKTQGMRAEPWREDLRLGAVRDGDDLVIHLAAEQDWEGVVHFDVPRHRILMQLPTDGPRINRFPEWFTVEAEREYEIRDPDPASWTGARLANGLPVRVRGKEPRTLRVLDPR